MSSTLESAQNNSKLGCFPFVIGGLSFFPLFGVLFGVAAIIWGLSARQRGGVRLALVGAAGILFSVLLYGGLFYFGFVQRGGIYDDLRTKLAQNNLNALVQSVEFYKLGHGAYPDSLDTLKASLNKGSLEAIYVLDPRISPTGKQGQFFYYKRVDSDHYYLRGVAPDGMPFSSGALVPQTPAPGGKIGLLIESPPTAP
jgi:hypothetical protein